MEEPRQVPEPTTQTPRDRIEIEVESEHIIICETILASDLNKKKKTKRYVVFNKKASTVLAEIYWNGPWRQYCFYPEPQCVWSTSCLDTIVEFTKKINKEHNEQRKRS